MFGFKFVSCSPTTYCIHSVNGRVKREGAGLSFLVFEPWANLVAVPIASADLPFVFNIVTSDFQAITLQGQLTYRVSEPRRLADLLDFSVDAEMRPLSDALEGLEQRLVHAAQVHANDVAGTRTLHETLTSTAKLRQAIIDRLHKDELLTMLGVEMLGLSILSVKPTPETARALEAEAREALLRQADDAIYERRQHSLEQERVIKETELATRMAVDEKERAIETARIEGNIAAERQRSELVTISAENERVSADARAYALEAAVKPVRDLDVRKVMALMAGSADPRATIAQAFQELAENAQHIGELNVSPDLLRSLLSKDS